MNKVLVAVIAFAFAGSNVMAQKKKDKPQEKEKQMITTASGLQYVISERSKSDRQPKKGDKVTVHYTGKLTNDTVFDSSVSRGQPFSFTLGVGQVIKGWDEGIALLHVGDKATLTIPSQLGYGERASGKIPANSTLIFDVELIDFTERVVPKPFEVKGLDTVTTETGLKYIKVKSTEGVAPKPGQTVTVHYTGYLLDGSMFDSSVERGQPFQFQLGKQMVIAGWDEAVAKLKIGEKARLIIPHNLGYGERGFPPVIPAKATLVFDVELLGAQ